MEPCSPHGNIITPSGPCSMIKLIAQILGNIVLDSTHLSICYKWNHPLHELSNMMYFLPLQSPKSGIFMLPGLTLHRGNESDCPHALRSLPWCPWNTPVKNYNFLIGWPTNENMPWCPCLIKNEAYRPVLQYYNTCLAFIYWIYVL